MGYLSWIADEDLRLCVDEVLKSARDNDLNSNVIDPFSATFDIMRQGIGWDEWLRQENSRQVQKSFQNSIGYFHQHILGKVPGCEDPGRSGVYDFINHQKKIVAEIKNKYNTMNAGAARSVYQNLTGFLDEELKGYIGYVVFIVPRHPADFVRPWTTGGLPQRDDLLQIDGESFYRLATGDPNALKNLFEVLPLVIAEILQVQSPAPDLLEKFSKLFKKVYK
ncbi:MAG: Eco47II family restriction endonuclease [Candidatus Nomurabacteria bacterium]|jgi:hypothetical protein|nr:Eco47II family restriction endonuclease [Candidatus Nomurabacteria bacterium]